MLKRYSMKQVYMATLCLYLVSLPLNAINIGSFGSALKVLAIFPVFFALFSGNSLRVSKMVGWQFFFTVFACLSIFWSVNLDQSFSRAITYILLFLLLASGTFFDYTKKDLDTIQKALVWSSRVTAAVAFLFAQYVGGRLTLVNSVIKEDPNYLCGYYCFGLVYALSVLMREDKKMYQKVFAVVEIIAYLYLVLMSGSRGGLLAVVAALLAFLLFSRNGGKYSVGKRVTLLVMICAVFYIGIELLPEVLKSRFDFAAALDSGATGRFDIWDNAFTLFEDSGTLRKLFGQGTATARWCMRYYLFDIDNVTHNMFIETLLELGIVGLVLYTVAIFGFARKAFSQDDKFAFAVIMGMVVLSLSTSIYAFKPYFHIMLYIILSSNRLSEEETLPESVRKIKKK